MSKYLPPLIDYSASVTGVLESRCLEIVDMMAKWELDNNIRKRAIKAEDLKNRISSAKMLLDNLYRSWKRGQEATFGVLKHPKWYSQDIMMGNWQMPTQQVQRLING